MSRPRRPRLRFIESAESATSCSSRRTNCGMTRMPSRNPVSAMSAMRPSMMTLVSRILNDLLADLLAAEHAAQGRQVEHVALAGAHHQADVGHPEQQPDLKEG